MVHGEELGLNGKKIDAAALHEKYLTERNKRIRDDGAEQYIDVQDEFSDFVFDPWVKQPLVREPVEREVNVAVLGGGMVGILSSIGLKKAGIEDFVIVEEAGGFGGTWYWNRYPGIRCDIEAYVYMPLLEESDTVPSEKYASGAEILAHFERLARIYGLYEKALLETRMESVVWDEESARWTVRTNRGDVLRARFVMSGNGFLHRPKLPGVPGIRTFKGKMFHTARWDYEYTGGDSLGNLTGLKGKRVALIGTGATSIQILPHLAASGAQVYLFQRTPSAVAARNNRKTDVDWFKSLQPGWQQERINNFQKVIEGKPQDVDLVNDCWTKSLSKLWAAAMNNMGGESDLSVEDQSQLADFQVMQDIRDRIDEIVKDAKTAAGLKPWYNMLCKRPLFSDDYLESFNLPNVTLVDTDGKGIARITEKGIVSNGEEYELDCIIFASGFRVGAYGAHANSYSIVGRDGVKMEEKWISGVKSSVHGTQLNEFPNYHLVGSLAQAVSAINYTQIALGQVDHAVRIVARCLDEKIKVMEVTEEAEKAWLDELRAKHNDRSKFESECTPGYYNNEGKSGEGAFFGQLYGPGPFGYFEQLAQWRAADWRKQARLVHE